MSAFVFQGSRGLQSEHFQYRRFQRDIAEDVNRCGGLKCIDCIDVLLLTVLMFYCWLYWCTIDCIDVLLLTVLMFHCWLYWCFTVYCIDVLLLTVLMFYCLLYWCFTLDAGLLANSQFPGRSCDRPPRHRVFLVSLCLKANAEMVPKFSRCHYMLLMWPSRSKLSSNCIHVN
jgi:hypothetical protein